MAEYPLNQSSWGRARQETVSVFPTIKFWVVQMISAPLVATGMYFAIPSFASTFIKYIIPIATFSIWMLAVLCGVFLLSLVVAPYKQRDQARTMLRAKAKPILLQNRKELIEAIAIVENTTIQLVNCQNAINTNSHVINAESYARRDDAYKKWNDSMNELRRQYLVAGDEYESIAIDFTGFVGLQVMSIMGQLKYPDDVKPIVLQNTLAFAGALASRVKEAIHKIDELSGQVPYKEGSQSE